MTTTEQFTIAVYKFLTAPSAQSRHVSLMTVDRLHRLLPLDTVEACCALAQEYAQPTVSKMTM